MGLGQALKAGPGHHTDITGTVTVTLPQSTCKLSRFMCVTLMAGAGAGYKDATDKNNKMCADIRLQRGCNAGA